MLIPRTLFWIVVLTAVFMIMTGLSQLAKASTKQAAYTQTWCDKLNGVRVVDNGFVIPCLTSKYAVFTEAQPIVKYLIEYRDKYRQKPLLKIKGKQ